MKKTITIILIMLMALTCALAFVGCNKPSQTPADGENVEQGDGNDVGNNNVENNDGGEDSGVIIAGVLAESVYDSVEDAVKGFLAEEVSCATYTAEFVGYTKTDDLTQEQINGLVLDDELSGQVAGAEIGEVEYIGQSGEQQTSLARSGNRTYKRNIYIIFRIINDLRKYQFYTLSNEAVGESMSKSSMASLLDADKYGNCTITFIQLSGDDSIIYKYADDAIYAYGESAFCYLYNGQSLYIMNTDYGEENWKVTEFIDASSEEWSTFGDWSYLKKYFFISTMLEAVDINDFAFIYNYYSYLTKTETGYSFSSSDFGIDYLDFYIDFNITVSDGKILEYVYTDYRGHQVKVTFTDFGATIFEPTADMLRAIEDYHNVNDSDNGDNQ